MGSHSDTWGSNERCVFYIRIEHVDFTTAAVIKLKLHYN